MSWDGYIDNIISQSKDASGTTHVDKAAIIGMDGGGSWTTPGYAKALNLQGSEGAIIAKCFKNKDFKVLQATGIRVEGVKYQFLREEDKKIILGKKKGCGSITIQASKTALVIGHSPEGKQHGNTNKAVDIVAEYLRGMNM